MRGSMGSVSERAAARTHLIGRLCPLPKHGTATRGVAHFVPSVYGSGPLPALPLLRVSAAGHLPSASPAWIGLLCASDSVGGASSSPHPDVLKRVSGNGLYRLGAPVRVGFLVHLAKASSILVFRYHLCFQGYLLTGVHRRELKV